MLKEIYKLFRQSLPYIIRDEETALRILGNPENKIIEERNMEAQLIGVSVIHKNTILLLCVEENYRRQGVPTSKRYAPAVNERLDERIDDTASHFFEKRGYAHDWGDKCNCFDMKFPLSDFDKNEYRIGDTIEGITYRWATTGDLPGITACTSEACEEFTKYYQEEFIYTENKSSRVLIATCGDMVAGTLMVDMDVESGLGSVGCTAVHPDFQGKHIAVNMVTLGTKHLKDVGMKEAYLSYTYSGLDHMYGYAGYKIFVYFMMAKKKLEAK